MTELDNVDLIVDADHEIHVVQASPMWADIDEWGRYRPLLVQWGLFHPELFHKLNNWRKDRMARRVFTIELKTEMEDNDPRLEPMKKVLQRYARDLLATAALIVGDKKPPEVVTFTEDQFFGVEDIEAMPENADEAAFALPNEAEVPVTTEGNEDGEPASA